MAMGMPGAVWTVLIVLDSTHDSMAIAQCADAPMDAIMTKSIGVAGSSQNISRLPIIVYTVNVHALITFRTMKSEKVYI